MKRDQISINRKISESLSGRFSVEFFCKRCEIWILGQRPYREHWKTTHPKKQIPFKNRAFDSFTRDGQRKLRLLEERGHRCEVCRRKKWNGKKIPIQIDHIDGNSDNNDKSNLRLICPNCHAQTPTYCGKNAGRAGQARKERYEKYPNYRMLKRTRGEMIS